MQKLMLILMIGVGCTLSNKSFGQDEDKPAIRVGLKGGLNLSNVYDEQGEQFVAEDKFGLAGGGFLRIRLGEYVDFQPEFMFAQKGFSATGNFGILGTYSFTRTTSFFEIPLLLGIRPNEYFSFLIGPEYCYLFNSRDVYSRSDGTITHVEEEEISNDNIRKNILALNLGFDVNINQVVLSGRAGWDLQKNHGNGTSSAPRYKNNWLQFTVGFVFN